VEPRSPGAIVGAGVPRAAAVSPAHGGTKFSPKVSVPTAAPHLSSSGWPLVRRVQQAEPDLSRRVWRRCARLYRAARDVGFVRCAVATAQPVSAAAERCDAAPLTLPPQLFGSGPCICTLADDIWRSALTRVGTHSRLRGVGTSGFCRQAWRRRTHLAVECSLRMLMGLHAGEDAAHAWACGRVPPNVVPLGVPCPQVLWLAAGKSSSGRQCTSGAQWLHQGPK
jgi:hypothetical protein